MRRNVWGISKTRVLLAITYYYFPKDCNKYQYGKHYKMHLILIS